MKKKLERISFENSLQPVMPYMTNTFLGYLHRVIPTQGVSVSK